jgi:hypothetical protein
VNTSDTANGLQTLSGGNDSAAIRRCRRGNLGQIEKENVKFGTQISGLRGNKTKYKKVDIGFGLRTSTRCLHE